MERLDGEIERERERGRRKGGQRMITGKRVFEGCGGGIKASSGNPDWLKGAMRDYERIYLRFSAAAAACHCRRRWRCWYCNISTWIGVQITKKRGGEERERERRARRGARRKEESPPKRGYKKG